MTDFRLVRVPPRLQWRYRSGFEPDSLFSVQPKRTARHSNALIVYTILSIPDFVKGDFPDVSAARQQFWRLTNPEGICTIMEIKPYSASVSGRVRHRKRIENRVKLPDGTAAVNAMVHS